MSIEPPVQLILTIVARTDVSPSALADFAIDALVGDSRFKPDYWQVLSEVGKDGGDRKGAPDRSSLEKAGDALSRGFAIEGRKVGLTVEPVAAHMAKRPLESFGASEGWRLRNTAVTATMPPDAEALLEVIAFHADLLRSAVDAFPVFRASLRRKGEGSIGPFPPLARPDVLMDMIPMGEVERDYPNPQAFLETWDRVSEGDSGSVLVERGLGIADELEWKRRSVRDSMALARAARPGLTRWAGRNPTQREQAMLAEAESFIEPVGYDPKDRSVEFTAVVPKDEHLPAIDLFTLQDWKEASVENVGEVEKVKVTFPDRGMAEREAQQLRELGVQIQFYDEGGTVRPLID